MNLAVAITLVLAACAGVERPVGQSREELLEAFGEVQDDFVARYLPNAVLRGMVISPAIDRRGMPIAPAVTFAATDPLVTALVAVGEVPEGSTLTVEWFRLDGFGGPQHLFSHEITVAASQRAFSVGLSQGMLAAGWYEVVASLGGHELATLWRVAEEGETAHTVGSASQATAGETAEAQPPASGPSDSFDWDDDGWYEGVSPELREWWDKIESGERYYEPAPPTPCHMDEVWVEFAPFELEERVWTEAFAPGCDIEERAGITMVAAIVGQPTRIPATVTGPGKQARFDSCLLASGESDMPGTEIHVVAWLAGREAESKAGQTQIPDFYPDNFVLMVKSHPAPGSTVEPGDEITIRALAMEVMLLGPGIRSIRVEGPEGVLADEVFDTPDCDLRRHVAALAAGTAAEGWEGRRRDEVTYIVPEDPPPVIVIRVFAEDAWGRRVLLIDPPGGEIMFITEDIEHWSGTFVSVITGGGCSGSAEGAVRLTVEGGQVTGSIDGTEAGSCDTALGPVAFANAGTLGLEGSIFDGAAFRFRVSENLTSATGIASWVCFGADPAITVGPPGTASAQWTFGGEITYSCSVTLQREDGAG
ncbi:MAG TPA: hypothetical protein VMM81_05495 [Acidimicrobiia bacterium]|nr:hypothetical protein [Acidimicrobiia bacterium]